MSEQPRTDQPTTDQLSPTDSISVRDELAVLDDLEADLVAVEQAIESLERVSSEGLDGAEAATRIAAAVSVDRFGTD